MKVLALVLVALLTGCLVHDDTSKKKLMAVELPWEKEGIDPQVTKEANTIFDLCGSRIGKWQGYEEIRHGVPHVNWDGKSNLKKIKAHRYVDIAEAEKGKPKCELQIWVDSLAVDYMKEHKVVCEHPEKGKVFFMLYFSKYEDPDNELGGDIKFKRSPDKGWDCEDKLLFIAGNVDGSLTVVTGQEPSLDLVSPFDGSQIMGYKGQIFSADRRGTLRKKIEDTVVKSDLTTYKE